MSPLRELTAHFFRGLLNQEALAGQSESRYSITPILAVLFVPGLFIGMYQFPKYVRLAFGPPAQTEAAASVDRLMFVFFSMIVVGFLAVLQWDALFPDARDYRILGPLPIAMRTIFGAKLLALAGFFGLFAVDVNVASTILFPAAAIGPHEPIAHLLRLAGSHAVSVLGASAFVFLAVVAWQGALMNLLPPRLFRRVSVYAQFMTLFGLFSALFLWPKIASVYLPMKQRAAPGFFLAPPFWFAGLYQQLAGGGDETDAHQADRAVLALIAVVLLASLTYLISYRRHLRRMLEAPRGHADDRHVLAGVLEALANRVVVRKPAQQAAFHFVAKTMLRSKPHRLILAAYLGVALALVLDGVLASRDLEQFLQYRPDSALCTMPLVFSFFLLSGMRAVFKLPAELRANWIFRLAEPDHQRQGLAGVRRAMWLLGLGPAVPLLPLYAALWGWQTAGHHLVFGGVLALILVEALLLHLQSIPFTCSRVPGRANLTTAWTLYFLAFLMYVYTAARVGYWMQQAPLRLALGYAVVGLVLIALMLHRNQLLREDGTLVFEEEMEPAVRVLHLT